MAIKLGNNDIDKLYLGSTEITKAYLGVDEVYPNQTNPFDTAVLAYDTKDLGIGGINAVRLRRTGGAIPTEDVFTFAEIANGTAEAWVGVGNDGLVVDYIKQTTTGVDANQIISINQPILIRNGVLVDSVNKSIEFDGVNDSLEIPSTIHNDLTNNHCTVGIWFKTNDATKLQLLISDFDAVFPDRKLSMYINSSKLNIAVGDNGSSIILNSVNNVNDNQWHFGMLKYNGSADAELYLDDVFQDSHTFVNAPSNTNPIDIGARSTVFYFDGNISKILFYNGTTTRTLDGLIFNEGI